MCSTFSEFTKFTYQIAMAKAVLSKVPNNQNGFINFFFFQWINCMCVYTRTRHILSNISILFTSNKLFLSSKSQFLFYFILSDIKWQIIKIHRMCCFIKWSLCGAVVSSSVRLLGRSAAVLWASVHFHKQPQKQTKNELNLQKT